MILTLVQMLDRWRTAHNLEPARLDCSVEVFEGWDVNERLTLEARQWYLHLLDTAPASCLCPHDISDRVRLTAPADLTGVRTAPLPDDVRRVLTLTVSGAAAPVTVTDADGVDAATLRRLRGCAGNHYTAGNAATPVAAVSGRTLWLWTGTAMPEVTEIRAVTDPGEDVFELDESALALIPKRL